MGLENMGEVPFHTVYLHGLIRDRGGEKMSRSKLRANAMSPAEPIRDYGVDALRFALTVGSTAGNDMGLGQDQTGIRPQFRQQAVECHQVYPAEPGRLKGQRLRH